MLLLPGLSTFVGAAGGGVHSGEECVDEQGDANGEAPASRPRLSLFVSGADDCDSAAQLLDSSTTSSGGRIERANGSSALTPAPGSPPTPPLSACCIC